MSLKQRILNKESWAAYRKSLRFSLHCIVRPFDGFWDLTHEKRGSLAAANTLVVVVYCVANWCLTTLFDGKGTLKDIYMGTAYAMTPYILIQLPLVVLSNFVTEEEGAFYLYFGYFSFVWCGFLIVASVMMIHDFLLGKAFLALVFSGVGMLVIVFLMVLFFSLISDGFAYFYSLYKEIVYRFY